MTKLKHHIAAVLCPAARIYVRYGSGLPGRKTFFGRFSWVVKSGQTKTRYGFRMAFDSRDVIRRTIHWFGVWEPAISEFVATRLKPSDCFIDVGCNVGYFSLLAASLIGAGGSVVAIDASTQMGSMLESNRAMNGYNNIQFVHGAVSNEFGTLILYPGTSGNSGQASVVLNLTGAAGETVKAAPIAHWVKRDIWERARIIKIDIEGAEGHFMAGLGDGLASLRPDCEILMELSPAALLIAGYPVNELIETMARGGFHAYRIENRYDDEFYISPHHNQTLQRLRKTPTEAIDVVFSRADSDSLPLHLL